MRFLGQGLDQAFACADLFLFSEHRSLGSQARGQLPLKLQARRPLMGATAPPQTVLDPARLAAHLSPPLKLLPLKAHGNCSLQTDEPLSPGPALLRNHLHSVQKCAQNGSEESLAGLPGPHSFSMLLWPPRFIIIYEGGRAGQTPAQLESAWKWNPFPH